MTRDKGSLLSALCRIVPHDLAYAGGPISTAQGMLYPSESDSIARAVPLRQAEFRAGRCYARQALRQLGYEDREIGRAPNRSPIWPPGLVGTITHSRELAAAVVGSGAAYRGVGIDIEAATPLDRNLYALIGRPEERAAFANPLRTSLGLLDRGKLVFSIKEAIFKALDPQLEVRLGFQDACVKVDELREGFTAKLYARTPLEAMSLRLKGSWALVGGHVLTFLSVKQNAARRQLEPPPPSRFARQ